MLEIGGSKTTGDTSFGVASRTPEQASGTDEISLSVSSLIQSSLAEFEDFLSRAAPDAPRRTEAEIIRLRELVAFVARVQVKNFALDVLPSPQGGWACAVSPEAGKAAERYLLGEISSLDQIPAHLFRPTQIFYDLNELAFAPEEWVYGLLAHEVGHALWTDYKLFFAGQRQALKDGCLPTTWAFLFNALEDPWVNNQQMRASATTRNDLSLTYGCTIIPEMGEQINSCPPTIQFGFNIIHYWWTGQNIPGLTNQKVLTLFEELRPAIDKFINGGTAGENFKILQHEIWPKFKALEELSASEEAFKEFMRRASGLESDSGSEAQGTSDAKPSKFKAWLGKALEPLEAPAPEWVKKLLEPLLPQKSGGGSGGGASGKGNFWRQVRKELEGQLGEGGNVAVDIGSGPRLNLPPDIEIAEIPEAMRKQLEKEWEALSAREKRDFEKAAQENLDKKQSEVNKRIGSRHLQEGKTKDGKRIATFGDSPAPADVARSKQEVEGAIEESANGEFPQKSALSDQAAASQSDLDGAADNHLEEQMEMHEHGFHENEEKLFHRFLELELEQRAEVTQFIDALKPYLPTHKVQEFGGEFFSGPEINADLIAERIPVGNHEIYQRPSLVSTEKIDLSLVLLVDMSTSMAGAKMEAALKTALFWARACHSFNIPFEIKFFAGSVRPGLNFTEDYDAPEARIKPKLMRLIQTCGGGTDIGKALKQAETDLIKQERSGVSHHGAIVMISDSGASEGIQGEALKRYIDNLGRKYPLWDVILGGSKEDIEAANYYFGEERVIRCDTISEMSQLSFSLLRKVLEPLLFRQY